MLSKFSNNIIYIFHILLSYTVFFQEFLLWILYFIKLIVFFFILLLNSVVGEIQAGTLKVGENVNTSLNSRDLEWKIQLSLLNLLSTDVSFLLNICLPRFPCGNVGIASILVILTLVCRHYSSGSWGTCMLESDLG